MDEITDGHLWWWSALTYGVGDVVTTQVGMSVDNIEERNPLMARVLDEYGFAGMATTKLIVMPVAYAAYNQIDKKYRAGVPLGLSVLGTSVVLSNTYKITKALKQ